MVELVKFLFDKGVPVSSHLTNFAISHISLYYIAQICIGPLDFLLLDVNFLCHLQRNRPI